MERYRGYEDMKSQNAGNFICHGGMLIMSYWPVGQKRSVVAQNLIYKHGSMTVNKKCQPLKTFINLLEYTTLQAAYLFIYAPLSFFNSFPSNSFIPF